MNYLLDTNTLIYFFKDMGNVGASFYACKPRDVAIPSIVLYELYVGIKKSNNPNHRAQQLNTLLTQVKVIPFNRAEALASAAIRAQLESSGTPIGPYDTLIAGTALANQMTLVTHNTKEFSKVIELNLTDWF